MSLIAREAVRITPETVYGTYNSSASSSAVAQLHLPDGNSQTIRAKPVRWNERSAGGSNRKVLTGSEQMIVEGSIKTKLFPSQGKILIPPAITLAGSPMLDLPSFTVDHKIIFDDGSGSSYTRTPGCKVESLDISATNAAGSTVVAIALGVVGRTIDRTITITDFAEPDFTTAPHYPTEDPFAFQDLAGHVTIGSLRTGFREMKLSVKNMMRKPFDENRLIREPHWSGRDVSLELTLRYTSNADRQAFEDVNGQAVSIAFYDGTNTATFDLKGKCYFDTVDDDLPFVGDGYYQKIVLGAYLDTTLGTPNDLTFVQTP